MGWIYRNANAPLRASVPCPSVRTLLAGPADRPIGLLLSPMVSKKRERHFPHLALAPPRRSPFACHLRRWGRSTRAANPPTDRCYFATAARQWRGRPQPLNRRCRLHHVGRTPGRRLGRPLPPPAQLTRMQLTAARAEPACTHLALA